MASAELTSTGRSGLIEQRSFDRTYFTSDARATRTDVLLRKREIVNHFAEINKNRRTVFRARCSPEVIEELEQKNDRPSVSLPLSELGLNNDVLASFESNIHPSEVPEWDAVYADWKVKKEIKNPSDQILQLPEGYSLTNNFKPEDSETLYQLWKSFGWTREKISHFISTYKAENSGVWVSGVRDNNNELASACMGEALYFDGIYMVEATEFGTREDQRRKNLSTAAVIGLNAQIIESSVYRDGTIPLIISEYNMDPASRSDKVGRNAGMTIPGVDGVEGLTEPTQVLRDNVAVVDEGNPNTIDLAALHNQTGKEYGHDYQYLRNFIVGMMTRENMEKYYSREQVGQILSKFINN